MKYNQTLFGSPKMKYFWSLFTLSIDPTVKYPLTLQTLHSLYPFSQSNTAFASLPNYTWYHGWPWFFLREHCFLPFLGLELFTSRWGLKVINAATRTKMSLHCLLNLKIKMQQRLCQNFFWKSYSYSRNIHISGWEPKIQWLFALVT